MPRPSSPPLTDDEEIAIRGLRGVRAKARKVSALRVEHGGAVVSKTWLARQLTKRSIARASHNPKRPETFGDNVADSLNPDSSQNLVVGGVRVPEYHPGGNPPPKPPGSSEEANGDGGKQEVAKGGSA